MANTQGVDRLLLVDDNPTNLQVLYQALEEEGYELLIAQSGEEALKTAKLAQPQLILLDINMPGIDGYETCRRLKADSATQHSVVVFLSARGEVKDKVRGLDLGAVDYIGKPFQFEEVVARVRKHLQTYHDQRVLLSQNQQLKEQLAGGFPELSDADLQQIVSSGESGHVEFKSTLRRNLHTGKPDKRIENACLKTVAAFLNTRGGTLLVGVDDECQAIGIDNDQFANEDKLQLHWTAIVNQYLGVHCNAMMRTLVRNLDDQRILVVQCLPSAEPVFFRRDNEELFFVRTGNGTNQLKPSEILSYLSQRDSQSGD